MRRRSASAGLLEAAGQFDQAEDPGVPAAAATAPAGARSQPARLQTEFGFELPRGYVDGNGVVHRHGRMRLATARDELDPLTDIRVRENPAYLSIVLLSMVITEIGTVTNITAEVVERLFASDLAFLQDFYQRINAEGHTRAEVTCPTCASAFEVDIAGSRPGES